MMDKMVAQLKTEQQDDTEKLEYCGKEVDLADDKNKALERFVADLEKGNCKNKRNDINYDR